MIEGDSITYYLHGIMDGSGADFRHLDGATINHSGIELEELFTDGCKAKGKNYTKHFRLDGTIVISDLIDLAEAFLPNEKLNSEYFDTSISSEI